MQRRKIATALVTRLAGEVGVTTAKKKLWPHYPEFLLTSNYHKAYEDLANTVGKSFDSGEGYDTDQLVSEWAQRHPNLTPHEEHTVGVQMHEDTNDDDLYNSMLGAEVPPVGEREWMALDDQGNPHRTDNLEPELKGSAVEEDLSQAPPQVKKIWDDIGKGNYRPQDI